MCRSMLVELSGIKGTYVLIISLDRARSIVVGRLGEIRFPRALYAYIGSAYGLGGIKARVERHIKKKNKRKFWHIDYLLEYANVERVLIIKDMRLECYIARMLQKFGFKHIPSFGSSDCRCRSHLFVIKNVESLKYIFKSKKIKFIELKISSLRRMILGDEGI